MLFIERLKGMQMYFVKPTEAWVWIRIYQTSGGRIQTRKFFILFSKRIAFAYFYTKLVGGTRLVAEVKNYLFYPSCIHNMF